MDIGTFVTIMAISLIMFVVPGIVKVRLGYSFWPWGDI